MLRLARSLTPLLVRAVLGVAVLATAAGSARAEGDDRAAAIALLGGAAPLGPPAVTAEAIERATEAIERSTRLRAAGDEAHARVADGLAREWAETARDLGLAAAAEKLADDRRRQAIQAQAQLQRTKALVEEGIARLGRLRADLDAASRQASRAAGAGVAKRPATSGESGAPTTSPAPSAPATTGSTP